MKRTGGISIGCIVAAIVVGLVGYSAYVIIPIKVKAAEFEKEVESFALKAASSGASLSNEKIVQALLDKADELELPVTEKEITIKRSGGAIRVEVEYSVPVNLLGYQFEMSFNPWYENPLF